MYYLISGTYPFEAPDLPDKICQQYVNFRSSRWSSISYEARDLIRKLLVKNPEERFTAYEALHHKFFE